MTFYNAVIVEKNSPEFGKVVANTKSPSKYKGMSKSQFKKAVKFISVFRLEIVKIMPLILYIFIVKNKNNAKFRHRFLRCNYR